MALSTGPASVHSLRSEAAPQPFGADAAGMTCLPADERTQFALPRVMSVATAARFGHSRAAVRHQVDRGRWQRLVPGVVLTAPGPVTRSDWALAAMELTGPRAALSGWDALRVYGLGASRPPTDDVLVLDRSGRHRRVGRARIRPTSRRYHAAPVAPLDHELAFVPIVSASRAVSDTAAVYRTLPPVRALVTTAIQRGLCTPEQLAAELDTAPRNWSALLRRSLGDVLDGSRSIAEAEAVDILRQADVPSFELNVPLVDAAGRVVAIADVLWRELRAIAEIDSREFHFDETSWKARVDDTTCSQRPASQCSTIRLPRSVAVGRHGPTAWRHGCAPEPPNSRCRTSLARCSGLPARTGRPPC